ncbi:hypothetical protein A6M14_07750 [Acinetobacter sp. Ac_877]|uniref:PAAR domain-containing protein n=1 Tax=Acinetobacter portensis TaxID=1839785 RepID=UPI00128CF9B1|nr:PAAR domain-containing protein [Acinetobacter portensis]MPW41275.1 hypothetical protein [Acinetobacter portensis]
MIRYQIFENDKTTVGGIVQRHTGGGKSFIWHGRLASNIGDKVNCPACGSTGIIQAAGMRRPFDNHKDIPALDGDLCICKCSPPPVLKNSQTTFKHNVTGGIVINIPKNPLNVSVPSLQQNLNNSFTDNRKFENYYTERNKTEYVKFYCGIMPYDQDKFGRSGGGVTVQVISGVCEFIVTYIVKDKKLFVTVSYVPPVVKHEANKIIPSATLRLYKENNRQFELLGTHKLKSDSGIWNTERGKEPVGFVNITLPKPDLSLLKVELDMGYQLVFDGGTVFPSPSFVKHSFTFNSAAREV